MLDPKHIAFLHKNTFKHNDWATPPDCYIEDGGGCYEQEFDLAPLSPLFCAGMGLPEGKPIKRKQKGRTHSLAISFSDWCVHDPALGFCLAWLQYSDAGAEGLDALFLRGRL